MPLKAWTASGPDAYSAVVFAETRGKARQAGMDALNEVGLWGLRFTDVVVRRAPQFDEYAERGKVPVQALLDHGWVAECPRCGAITSTDEGAVVIDEEVYCEKCARGVRAL